MLKSDKKLRKHQCEAILHLGKSKKGLVALPTGTGKSLLAMVYYKKLQMKGVLDKCVFVTEKNVLDQIDETSEVFFNTPLNILTIKGWWTPARRKKEYAKSDDFEIIVINYQKLKADLPFFVNLLMDNKVHLILDEGTAIKNPKSRTSKDVSKLAKLATRVMVMTATPVMKNLEDLYWILVNASIIKYSYPRFKDNFCKVEPRWVPGPFGRRRKVDQIVGYKNVSQFYELFADKFFTRKKSDVTDMPPFQIIKSRLTQTPETKDALNFLAGEYEIVPKALIQIANSAPAIILGTKTSIPTKAQDFIRYIDNNLENKMIVYTKYAKVAKYITALFNKNYGYDIAVVIHGGTKDTQAVKSKFLEDDRVKLLVGTQSIAKGVDGLQAVTDTVGFYDLPDTIGDFLQIIGRISRIGTKFTSFNLFIPMVEKSIDETLFTSLQTQIALLKKVHPDSIEEGIEDEMVQKVFDENTEPDTWVKKELMEVYEKYGITIE